MENERVEQETIKMEEKRKQSSKLEVIGAVISLGCSVSGLGLEPL